VPAPFAKVFRAPVRFGQRENVLEFAASDFDERLPAGNAALARHNDDVVAHYLARTERGRVSSRLRSWFIDQLAAGEPTEEAAARALGMSLPNLQRRLEAEGTSYRKAADYTRRDIARSYMDEGTPRSPRSHFFLASPTRVASRAPSGAGRGCHRARTFKTALVRGAGRADFRERRLRVTRAWCDRSSRWRLQDTAHIDSFNCNGY
jgi:AraC-like DNA-binding protein